MATSQELDKLPRQFRSRTNAAVINITTPEVQPNLGKHNRRSSAKKMLVNVQEEGAKSLGKKQRKAQRDNPVIDPNIDKRMLRRGIYSDFNDRSRSATILPLHPSSHSNFEVLPLAKDRRASLPYVHHKDVNIQQPSLNGSPHHFTPPGPGQSMDSGVDMGTVELTQIRPQGLASSLDDLTEQRSRTNSAQVQFPLSLANNVTNNVTTVQGCGEHSEHVLNQHGDCIVCDVLHSEQSINKAFPVNHTTPEQKETTLHNRDSGVGNDLQLNVLTSTNNQVGMLSNELLPSPSKGLQLNRSIELPSPSVDSRSPREKDFFETTNDLAKESAHFTMAELLIAASEKCKCINQEKLMENEDDNNSTQDLADSPGDAPLLHQSYPKLHQTCEVLTRTSAQPMAPWNGTGLGSAEYTAHQFLRYIEESVTRASPAGITPSSVIEHFTSMLSSRQTELSAKSITCNRGDEQWAPPRQQVIFTIPPNLKRHEALLKQEYRCHGCGMRVDKDLSKHFRYCHYSGKYFCLSCHSNSQDVIPAMVLNKWIFKKYPISNYAKSILDKTRNMPTFVIDTFMPDLYTKCSPLNRVRQIRQQLVMVRKYLVTCKFAEELLEKLTEMKHLTFDVHSYSLLDLIAVNAGQIQRPLQNILTESIKHVRLCDLCRQRGFICEFCKNQQDILYPFELDRVMRCVCHACFHRECYVREKCPRCLRLKLRQEQRNCINDDIS